MDLEATTINLKAGMTQLEAIDTQPQDAACHRKLRRKIDRRLMPLCVWIYLLNYLDRSNIGNAKVLNSETQDSFLQSLRMSSIQYSVTITLFSIAYAIFDVPANWVLKRFFRPCIWFSLLFLCWGILTVSFAFLKNYASVVVIRFLIGMFEAGFYPGLIYYVSFWYRYEERSLRIAIIGSSTCLSGAFGGCIAYGVAFINRHAGLRGWQWLFIIEGSVTIASTFLILLFLPDYPSSSMCKFLTSEEKQFAIQRLEEQDGGFTRESATRQEILAAVSPRMLVHYITFFLNIVVFSSLVYFCPTIVNGLGYTSIKAQLMTVPSWAIGFVVSLIVAYTADRYNARGYHASATSALCAIGFMTSALLPAHSYKARYGCLMVASLGAYPTISPLAGWVSCNAPSNKTNGLAIALNCTGTGLASIASVWIWKATEAKQGYPTGNKVCAVCSWVCCVLSLGLRWHYGRLNKRIRESGSGQREWML